jgi:hypothetical protein
MSTHDTLERVRVAEKAALFILGFGAVAMLQAVGGWWLNSGAGVLRAVVVFVVLGVCATRWRSGAPWVRACALWTGAVSGSTTVLFWIGPGNIWPIVLVFAAGITAAAVFGGAFLGSVWARFSRQPPERARNAR